MINYNRQNALFVLKRYLAPDRVNHCLSVEEYAKKLALIHAEDEELCSAAGLLHDMARDLGACEILTLAEQYGCLIDDIYIKHPNLLHGPASAQLVKLELEISDASILSAISNHTIPSANMTAVDKIIFIADKVELERSYPGVEKLRNLSEVNIDMCLYEILKQTIFHLVSKNAVIHPGTIKAYNNYVDAYKSFMIDK